MALALAGDAGIRDHGLAKRLARNRPGVETHAADARTLLDDGGALAELRRLHGGPLARGTAADGDEVEVERRHGAEGSRGARRFAYASMTDALVGTRGARGAWGVRLAPPIKTSLDRDLRAMCTA